MKKPKVFVVVGATCSGKTAYAVKLAKKVGGEVISADSRQVYRGLDLGSGKVTKKEMAGVPHHLLDVASPKRVFTVSNFRSLTEKKMREIVARGKTAIIAGGTGFYIQAVVDGLVLPAVAPNHNSAGWRRVTKVPRHRAVRSASGKGRGSRPRAVST